MLRLLSAASVVAGGLNVAACTTSTGGEALAGCSPGMSIYQPGVNGAPGTIMNLPGRCSPSIQASSALTASAAPSDAAPRPQPIALPNASQAIENGVSRLCGWFLAGEGYSLPAMQQTAFDAGFARGASVNIVPLPEMRAQLSYSSLNFTAAIANPTEGSGVAAFASFHDPVCQLQIYNYQGEAAAYAAGLESKGWRRVGAESTTGNVAASRWYGTLAGAPMTLVVNRWVGAEMAPGGLGYILNVVPGHNAVRGVLS